MEKPQDLSWFWTPYFKKLATLGWDKASMMLVHVFHSDGQISYQLTLKYGNDLVSVEGTSLMEVLDSMDFAMKDLDIHARVH